ncbi:hypothetical protein KJY73_21430 [Bowmanella sp. Y26]|uniref:hypothetical protein n=1 Tax=Bowmanella yangjiangensis TaxID=2811230 RepID=UPI001BDBD80D|nr:hypothetical protein [Bowmanella yangjiangensis]MBT1066152.1 hypothetical protein [Bowmanella yangjiangensis]
MKKGIALAFSLFSALSYADPAIFKMELGTTTEDQVKSMYSAKQTGVNKYSLGNMYDIPTGEVSFEGLKELTAIFDKNGVLVGVLTTFNKSKFDYLNQAIGGKYKLVSQRIPFVGDKSATYRDGATEISLNAPHMGFDMSMNYLRDELTQAFNKQTEAEKRAKQNKETSQL